MTKLARSILDYFPAGRKPRDVQVQALQKIEQAWSAADVIVVNLPVASGKSNVAYTLARWASSVHKQTSIITTPTNILVEQYQGDFTALPVLKKSALYECQLHDLDLVRPSCARISKLMKRHCNACPYVKANRRAFAVPFLVCNSYMQLARKLHRDVLIADEAHKLIDSIRELNAKHYWIDELKLPAWVRSYSQLYKWLLPRRQESGIYAHLLEELENNKTRFIITRGVKDFRGEERDALFLAPVDIRDSAPFFWPNRTKKIVLMSATINRKDIEQMGLDKRRVTFIEAPSPIPAERRPVVLECSLNMSYAYVDKNMPALIERIKELLEENPEKGMVHVTYGMMSALAEALGSERRLIFHTKENKRQQYELFRRTEGTVLVAAGMYEGVDLPEDAGRWQLITKVPWPALSDPAIKYMADLDPEWYAWEAAKVVLQGVGRICRGPQDYGKTIILDSTFQRLYDSYREFFPAYWTDSVIQPTDFGLKNQKI